MRLPVEWITEYAPAPADPEQIALALTMAGLEVEATEQTDQGAVLDIKVTPNRGDCLSVVGVARELAARYGVPLGVSAVSGSSEDEPPDAASYVSVEIADADLCPRYAARVVEDVRHDESPLWMQARLMAAGMRPIGGIVDVTNYVMLETGQPLHAFDYATLSRRRIIVRRAGPGETLTTIDGVVRSLTPEALVIADADKPVALAGVMGGSDSEITPSTTVLLLESAHFDWRSVRRTSRRLGLRTEASFRFERIVDPEGVVAAADRACELIARLGLGKPVLGVVDAYSRRAAARVLRLRPSRAAELLGFDVETSEASGCLSRLGFGVAPLDKEAISVTVPSWRPDVQRETDLVEEVGRVLGYERIPERLPRGATTQGGDSAAARFADDLRDRLVGAGLQEVVGHTLAAPSPFDGGWVIPERVAIRSALSEELSGLRVSLLPSLLDALDRNARRGQGPLALFEIGRVFRTEGAADHRECVSVGGVVCGSWPGRSWHPAPSPVSPAFVARGVCDLLLGSASSEAVYTLSSDARLHPGRQALVALRGKRVGVVGELHPELAVRLRVRDRVAMFEMDGGALLEAVAGPCPFVAPSPYPSVVRDLAPRVATSVPYADIRAAVLQAGGPLLGEVALVDVYAGDRLPDGVRSLTLSLTLRSLDRTLTDAESEVTLDLIRERLRSEFGATFVGD